MRRSARVLRDTAVLTLLLLLFLVPSYADLWVPQNIGLPSFGDGRVSLAIDSNDSPGLTYAGVSGGLQYATFSGGSWSNVTVVDGSYTGRGSSLVYQGTTPHIAYRASPDHTAHYLGYATFDGTDWHTTVFDSDVSPSAPRHCAIDLDSHGNPAIAYYDMHGLGSQDDAIYYRYFDGTDWSTRETIADDATIRSNIGGVDFVFGPGDTPYAGYITRVAGNDQQPTCAIRDLDGTWSPNIGLDGEATSQMGYYVSMAIDAMGHPNIAWVNGNQWAVPPVGDVNYSWYDGSQWHMETAIALDFHSSWDDRGYMDMAIDSWGFSHIVHYDPAGKQLLYTVGRPGDFWEAPRVLADNLTAWWVNVAVDSDNAPHFAYHSDECTWYGKGEPVPEPGTILLLASGIGALAVFRKRRGT